MANADGVVPLPQAETHPSDNNENGKDEDEDPAKLWYYCDKPAFGEMIMCNHRKNVLQVVPL